MIKSKQYAIDNRERFLETLFSLLSIPSISADLSHIDDMVAAAQSLASVLLEAGVDKAVVIPTAGNPIVYAEKIIDPQLPTVLVYGHYDVVPVGPIDAWHSPAFKPEIRDGKIYGRGADDDKGQSFIHIAAFEAMNRSGELCTNVKFMIEGEEEIGSINMEAWCKENVDMLYADIILVSDTSMLSLETPSITCGLRGISYMEVEVTGPSRDLHSGLFGGAVANPINVLSKMIASLTDDNNRITIPHFYDKVRDLTEQERVAFNKAPFCEYRYKNDIAVNDLSGEKGYTTIERSGVRPALDVNGIWGGHMGEGANTIIPSKAYAKISMRLVPDQDYNEIAELFEQYFISIAPKSVTVKVRHHHGGMPYVSPTSLAGYKAARMAVTEVFGKEPLPYYSGGSIPIVTVFDRVLSTKTILLGFGHSNDAIHSPNESFPLENFYKGIDTIISFYKHFAAIMAK